MRPKILATLVLMLGLAGSGLAQVPPPPPTPATPVATPAATPTTGRTLWDLLAGCQDHCQKCRERCCRTTFGQMLNNMCKPFSLATGGLFPPLCPPVPSQEEIAKLLDPNNLAASPAEAAAAKIKADEAGAAARRAAVRYLATVDCHYYPEAEKALIAALRGDRIECVRLEAAIALGSGCCCTKNTIEALALAASGADTDGNPGETSERVKAAALNSLHLCMCRFHEREAAGPAPTPPETPPEAAPPPRPERPGSAGQPLMSAPYELTGWSDPIPAHVLEASRALAATVGTTSTEPWRVPTGQRGLLQMLGHARHPVRLREEMSYEEAAMRAPIRRPVQTLLNQEPAQRPILGFQIVEPGSPTPR